MIYCNDILYKIKKKFYKRIRYKIKNKITTKKKQFPFFLILKKIDKSNIINELV